MEPFRAAPEAWWTQVLPQVPGWASVRQAVFFAIPQSDLWGESQLRTWFCFPLPFQVHSVWLIWSSVPDETQRCPLTLLRSLGLPWLWVRQATQHCLRTVAKMSGPIVTSQTLLLKWIFFSPTQAYARPEERGSGQLFLLPSSSNSFLILLIMEFTHPVLLRMVPCTCLLPGTSY